MIFSVLLMKSTRWKRQPDVVIHGGDIAHDGKLEEYRAAHDILKTLEAPLFVMPGNKDKRGPMGGGV